MISGSESVYVYNAITGEYFSLGAGWSSIEEVREYADEEGYLDSQTQEGVIGVEKEQV